MAIRNLFIASEVRSGSTFLAEAVSYSLHASFAVNFWDLAKEHFNSLTDRSTIEDISRIYDPLFINEWGFRSSKVMCASLSVICREAKLSQKLHDIFFGPDTYWVIVRRKNRIKQAVSLAYASASGIYHYYGDAEKAPDEDCVVSLPQIESSLRSITLSDEYLANFSRGLTNCIEIYYEDFLGNQNEFLCSLLTLMDKSEIAHSLIFAPPKIVQTATNSKIESESMFRSAFKENYHRLEDQPRLGSSGEEPRELPPNKLQVRAALVRHLRSLAIASGFDLFDLVSGPQVERAERVLQDNIRELEQKVRDLQTQKIAAEKAQVELEKRLTSSESAVLELKSANERLGNIDREREEALVATYRLLSEREAKISELANRNADATILQQELSRAMADKVLQISGLKISLAELDQRLDAAKAAATASEHELMLSRKTIAEQQIAASNANAVLQEKLQTIELQGAILESNAFKLSESEQLISRHETRISELEAIDCQAQERVSRQNIEIERLSLIISELSETISDKVRQIAALVEVTRDRDDKIEVLLRERQSARVREELATANYALAMRLHGEQVAMVQLLRDTLQAEQGRLLNRILNAFASAKGTKGSA